MHNTYAIKIDIYPYCAVPLWYGIYGTEGILQF